MKLQDADTARATALRYRLLSPWTNWLVVAVRAEARAAYDLPQIYAQRAYASIRDAALKIHIDRALAMIEERLPGAASACG